MAIERAMVAGATGSTLSGNTDAVGSGSVSAREEPGMLSGVLV